MIQLMEPIDFFASKNLTKLWNPEKFECELQNEIKNPERILVTLGNIFVGSQES